MGVPGSLVRQLVNPATRGVSATGVSTRMGKRKALSAYAIQGTGVGAQPVREARSCASSLPYPIVGLPTDLAGMLQGSSYARTGEACRKRSGLRVRVQSYLVQHPPPIRRRRAAARRPELGSPGSPLEALERLSVARGSRLTWA